MTAAACVAGCFTEVGNAEDDRLLEAQFRIDYSATVPARPKAAAAAAAQIASIERFYLYVREAEFQLFDSSKGERAEYHLWKEDSATLPVDFTGRDAGAVLPSQKVSDIDPLDMRLECALASRKALLADTLDYASFADPGYLKGKAWYGRDSAVFIFALPSAGELNLVYPKSVIAGWYSEGRYHCEFVFYANAWIASADLSKAKEIRDRSGARLLVFDEGHNADGFAALTAAFPRSFNAPTVQVKPEPEP